MMEIKKSGHLQKTAFLQQEEEFHEFLFAKLTVRHQKYVCHSGSLALQHFFQFFCRPSRFMVLATA